MLMNQVNHLNCTVGHFLNLFFFFWVWPYICAGLYHLILCNVFLLSFFLKHNTANNAACSPQLLYKLPNFELRFVHYLLVNFARLMLFSVPAISFTNIIETIQYWNIGSLSIFRKGVKCIGCSFRAPCFRALTSLPPLFNCVKNGYGQLYVLLLFCK